MTDPKDAEIDRLRKLCEECWGVLITAFLLEKEPKPEIYAALQHIDRRMRAEGLMPTPAKFVKP